MSYLLTVYVKLKIESRPNVSLLNSPWDNSTQLKVKNFSGLQMRFFNMALSVVEFDTPALGAP